MTPLPAVSLFSNCGAGDVGYAAAGFEFDVLAEIDPRRLEVAGLNHPGSQLVAGDLRDTWPAVVAAYRAERGDEAPALLAACPPCQGMSSARSDRGAEDDADAGSRDGRNLLVEVIARVTEALRPRLVVVENVPAFMRRKVRHPATGTPISAARLLRDRLETEYRMWALDVDLADYGVPQSRRRAFLCFVRTDEPAGESFISAGRAPFPRPTHSPDYHGRHVTLDEALAGFRLEPLDALSSASAGSGMHSVPVWPAERYQMVAAIPPGSGRGAWDNHRCLSCGTESEPDEARCRCCGELLARPVVVTNDGCARLVNGFRTSSYTRMRPNRPASTITTASHNTGSDRTIHPYENRVLSALECQLLQTIPSDFEWGDALDRWGVTNVRAMIGEAVPPAFTRLHGEVLVGGLLGVDAHPAIIDCDERVRRAVDRLARI